MQQLESCLDDKEGFAPEVECQAGPVGPPYLALVVAELRTPSAGSVQFQTVPVDPLLGPTRSAVYFGATVKLPLFSGPVP